MVSVCVCACASCVFEVYRTRIQIHVTCDMSHFTESPMIGPACMTCVVAVHQPAHIAIELRELCVECFNHPHIVSMPPLLAQCCELITTCKTCTRHRSDTHTRQSTSIIVKNTQAHCAIHCFDLHWQFSLRTCAAHCTRDSNTNDLRSKRARAISLKMLETN